MSGKSNSTYAGILAVLCASIVIVAYLIWSHGRLLAFERAITHERWVRDGDVYTNAQMDDVPPLEQLPYQKGEDWAAEPATEIEGAFPDISVYYADPPIVWDQIALGDYRTSHPWGLLARRNGQRALVTLKLENLPVDAIITYRDLVITIQEDGSLEWAGQLVYSRDAL